MANGLHLTMERKPGVAATRPDLHTQPRTSKLAAAALTLSRRNADAATCELLNEALCRLVDLAFEEDAGGLCNADFATGRLLIPLPWGRNGHVQWGLRPQEANILRQVLFAWRKDGTPLLIYDRGRRAWLVNLHDYADRDAAGRWLAAHQVSIADYRAARDKVLGVS